MKTTEKLPEALKRARKSKWIEDAKWRRENREWLTLSFHIASRVYAKIKSEGKTQQWLAEQLGCSAQYVGRMLKGNENLTIQTITKLEHVLGINLITLATPTQEVQLKLDVKPNVPNIGSITLMPQFGQMAVTESYQEYQTYTGAA